MKKKRLSIKDDPLADYLLVPLWNEGHAGAKEVPRYKVVTVEESNIPPALRGLQDDARPTPDILRRRQGRKGWVKKRTRPGHSRRLNTSLEETVLFPFRAWRSILLSGLLLVFFFFVARLILAQPNPDNLPTKLIWAFSLVFGGAAFCCGHWMAVLATTVRGEDSIMVRHHGLGCRDLPIHIVRCLVCFFAGPALILGVAYYYWLNCGDLQLADQLILAELILAAMMYWAFALLAVTAHNSLRSVLPTGIAGLLQRLGWRTSLVAALVMFFGIVLILGGFTYSLATLSDGGWGWFLLLTCCIGWQIFLALLCRWLGVKCFLADRAQKDRENVILDV